MNKTYMRKFFILVLATIWLVPPAALASEIFFKSDRSVFADKEKFLMEVFIDTEGAQINAVEGAVIFPDTVLSLQDIREGNSVLNFWVDKPQSKGAGQIYFSGMTPGGFSGSDRLLFSIVFEAKEPGEGRLGLTGARAFLNDGFGTQTEVKETFFDIAVSDSAENGGKDVTLSDTEPPEVFTPLVGRDASLLEGKYFVTFSTVDKGSGIDRYEVREGLRGEYKKAENPHPLADQSLRKNIYVKAVDKSENERVVKIKAPKGRVWLDAWPILVIISLAVIFMLRKKIWPKRQE